MVPDLGRGQPAAADESIAWHAGPTGFDKEFAHAIGERDEAADHGRIADPKAVVVGARHLNCGALAVGFTGVVQKARHEPIDSRRAQQIVGISQGNVVGHIPAASAARSQLSLRKGCCPRFVQFTHDLFGKGTRSKEMVS